MRMHCDQFEISLRTGPDMADVTLNIQQLLKESAIHSGMLQANVVGSTASLTTIEFEPGVVEDLAQAIKRLAPEDMPYAHERAWHDGNGHSHVQAALLGPSIALAVRDGQLVLGTWQQVVCINHDNKPRYRQIVVTIFGTSR